MLLSELHLNESNPRQIKGAAFEKLKKSVKELPKMMRLRPIVIDKDGVILGGNMRYRALQALGYSEIPNDWVKVADDLTDEEKQRFIIEDNVQFGEWDFDVLFNEWNTELLIGWGVDIPIMKEGGEEGEKEEKELEPFMSGFAFIKYPIARHADVIAVLEKLDNMEGVVYECSGK